MTIAPIVHLSASKYLSNELLIIYLLRKLADQLHRCALRKLLYDDYIQNPIIAMLNFQNSIPNLGTK